MTTNLKTIPALSIRQPWAWLIANGYKDIENRSWPIHYRGPILIHAGKAMTNDDYESANLTAISIVGQVLAEAPLTERGGIVGMAEIVDCVTQSDSPWFFGEYGFVLKNAKPLPFKACRGQLGLFKVEYF